ncbi:MAG TPA: SDR family NAD(P)-dependent oxidoreductase [Candidatus Coprousia avicola]|nr:SDR family NAD(P)-dependent oxidoreductase [Candidatus Coprousia avicola]
MSRIAIVTGASSGLGREFVRQIDTGAAGPVDEIWAIARHAEKLEALVRITQTPVRAFCLDLGDLESFDLIEAALAESPDAEVALLINGAGSGAFGPFAGQSKTSASDMVAVLMRAPVELTYRALPYLAPGSRILNISSVAAFAPQPELAVYAAAKRFVLDFSRALAVELEGTGITVTTVCPKPMRTGFFDAPGDVEAAARITRALGFEKVERVARHALKAAAQGRDLAISAPEMRLYYAASRLIPYRSLIALERALGILA